MNDLQGVRTVQSQAAQYVADVQALMNDLPVAAVPAVVEALLGAWRGGHPVFVCGNGGSAATASHFVNDLNKGTNVAGERRFTFPTSLPQQA